MQKFRVGDRGKLIAEFLLIVVGVLVALALEAAWQNRQDEALHLEYLSRIKEDITFDQQALAYRIEFFTDVIRFSDQVLDWTSSDAPVDEKLVLATFYAAEKLPFIPNSSTYSDLQSTGNIRLITNIDLRTSLVRYQNRADTTESAWNPSDDYRSIIRGIIPIDVQDRIRERCPTTDARDVVPTGFPTCSLGEINYSALSALFEPLRNDATFRQTLTFRHSELGVMLRLFRQQLTYGDEVLDHLPATVEPETTGGP